jgi:drug/metabolite transporter (DMT)-like permease
MGLVLSLAASVGWGTADFLGGMMSRRASLPTVLAFSQVAGLLAFAPLLALQGTALPGDGQVLLGGVAGVVAVAALGMIYHALGRGPVVLIAPIAALSVALPIVVGIAGGDRLDLLISVGLACAIAGALAASWTPEGDHAGRATLTAIGLAGGSALGTGTVLVLIDAASEASVWWGIGAMRLGGAMAALALLAALAAGRALSGRRAPGSLPRLPLLTGVAIAAIGASDLAADIAYAGATRTGALSVVSVVSSLYPVTAITLAALVLRERPAGVQLAGVALACVGIALLSATVSG